MNISEKILRGVLARGAGRFPVQFFPGGGLTLVLESMPDLPDAGFNFEHFLIDNGGEEFDLGPCRIVVPEAGKNPVLVTENLWDYKGLTHGGEPKSLDMEADRIELVVQMARSVKNDFKAMCADVLYTLNSYRSFYHDFDRLLAGEPEDVRGELEMSIISRIETDFYDYMDRTLEEMKTLTAGFTGEEHRNHGSYLRRHLWDILLQSEFMARTNLKPRGYIGDSETMRMIYENGYRGSSLFAKLLYHYSIAHPGAQAVRNRKVMVPRILGESLDRQKGVNPHRIMSIACGPADELRDYITSPEKAGALSITLLDQDGDALNEARENAALVEKNLGKKLSITYLQDSVRTMLMAGDLAGRWGSFNFIYSMGLFDYLTPPVAKAVAAKMYQLLEPGGSMMIGNYFVGNPSKFFMEYWHDWVLYYRNENDMNQLAGGLPGSVSEVFFEDSRCQLFLKVTKQ